MNLKTIQSLKTCKGKNGKNGKIGVVPAHISPEIYYSINSIEILAIALTSLSFPPPSVSFQSVPADCISSKHQASPLLTYFRLLDLGTPTLRLCLGARTSLLISIPR